MPAPGCVCAAYSIVCSHFSAADSILHVCACRTPSSTEEKVLGMDAPTGSRPGKINPAVVPADDHPTAPLVDVMAGRRLMVRVVVRLEGRIAPL